MHFEFLVEDLSGKKTLEILIPKIVGDKHSFRIISYKGVGSIPKNIKDCKNANKRILLNNLPRLLGGYGRTYAGKEYSDTAVVVVCDLDDRCLKTFRNELLGILNNCVYKPKTCFCIAVEENEAWYLGDLNAVKKAFPRVKEVVLASYKNDSICGTWEKLADAIYQGGASALLAKGWQIIGTEKSRWAKEITPFMNIENNNSPSFGYFKKKLHELIGII